MNPTIRQATVPDLAAMNKISVAAKMHWQYPAEWLAHWLPGLTVTVNDLMQAQYHCLVLRHKVVGFCGISESNTQYEIEHLWVLPQYIGQGYGKRLLGQALQWVVQKPKPIVVVADPNAQPFYAKQGFVTFSHQESYPKGRYLPVMKKTPTP